MTRKQFYLDLGKYIFETMNPNIDTPIQHFDLWNDQTGPDYKTGFKTPAAFLEFNPIQWQSLGGRKQQANISFNLHIVDKVNSQTSYNSPLRDNNLAHLDLLDKLHYYLTGFRGDYFTSLSRTASVQDHYFDALIKHVETYKTKFTTDSAVRSKVVKEGDLLEVETNILK